MHLARPGLAVFGKDTTHDIFVDLNAESERDDVCNAWITKAGVSLLQFNDSRDELPRWPFRPASFVTFVAEQVAIFTFGERVVEFEQSRWLDDYRHCE